MISSFLLLSIKNVVSLFLSLSDLTHYGVFFKGQLIIEFAKENEQKHTSNGLKFAIMIETSLKPYLKKKNTSDGLINFTRILSQILYGTV